jgi:hypothetical protein
MSSPTSLSARVAISVFHSHRRPAVTLPGRPSSPAPIPQPRPTPLRLTDGQLDIVMRAAAPLAPSDRRLFLRAVADALQDVAELGDGLVSRVCAEQQRRWFTPPAGRNPHWGSPVDVECQRHVKHPAREGRRA